MYCTLRCRLLLHCTLYVMFGLFFSPSISFCIVSFCSCVILTSQTHGMLTRVCNLMKSEKWKEALTVVSRSWIARFAKKTMWKALETDENEWFFTFCPWTTSTVGDGIVSKKQMSLCEICRRENRTSNDAFTSHRYSMSCTVCRYSSIGEPLPSFHFHLFHLRHTQTWMPSFTSSNNYYYYYHSLSIVHIFIIFISFRWKRLIVMLLYVARVCRRISSFPVFF